MHKNSPAEHSKPPQAPDVNVPHHQEKACNTRQICKGSDGMCDLKRHVKCDETKPACKNCIKWAGYCGGYEAIHSHSKSTTNHSSMRKPLIALPSPDLDVTSSPEELDMTTHDYFWQLQSPAASLSPPASIDFQNSPYTYPCYAATSYFPATSPATAFDDVFWECTLPRLIQDSAAIRYASLAVHTLIYAKSPESASLGKATGHDYYGEALICYGLALSETRKATSQQTDLREAVLSCMFFVIFETLNGDRASAQAHLQSGQRLSSELGADDFGQNLRNVLHYLAQQARECRVDDTNATAGERRCRILESLVF
ncbi:hypothetical protein E4U42_004216 [Claviceps africana]|uniref:Zn(2)-C6 fungal-type domain-containing protein n=1 Tax=Claviceps africana TaxID=83212 RepID=A0A8K0J5H7_9HYPO|nr:hypothetical protein E4U42_004216 [Claviceps africana]